MAISNSSSSLEDKDKNDPLSVNPYYMFCRSSFCEKIKLVIGTIAVSLLILVIFIGVALRYSVLQLHPVANFILLFFGLLLLAYVEALHYAVVAVEKWDMSLYSDKFPRAAKCHTLVDTPEKVKKFLVGRQFFVIFVVFLIAEITTFPRKISFSSSIVSSSLWLLFASFSFSFVLIFRSFF
jgi:hypothetical protein